MATKLAVITGAHGFLGRHVARRLAQEGWEVAGIGHGCWTKDEWQIFGLSNWHTCDVTIEGLLLYARTPNLIVHCAGSGSVGFSVTDPAQDYRRTVETTVNVLEYVRRYAPNAAVVYPSSAAVYGQADLMPICSTSERRPMSPYGVHKAVAEQLCESYGRHFGVCGTILRYFSLYGPELRKQLLWEACNKVRRGEMTFVGTGNEARDWLHASDAADLCCKAVPHAARNWPIANGGSGVATAVKDVIAELFKHMRCFETPRFSGLLRNGDPVSYQAEISLALSWGWRPTVNWRTGIREYVEWFKQDRA